MNRIDLEGRVVAITGGARGIGYAVAQRALKSGASVALWDIDAERLARSQQELSELGKVTAVTVEPVLDPIAVRIMGNDRIAEGRLHGVDVSAAA